MDSIGSSNSQIKRAMEHISESVFLGLCHTVGTSQLVAMRRDVMDITEIVRLQSIPSDEQRVTNSGSYREGFRLRESDRDFLWCPGDHFVIWKLSQSQYYNTDGQTLIRCDCSNSPPGFALLYLLSPTKDKEIQRACVRMNDRHYISSSKYRHIKCTSSPPYSTEHGPCESGSRGGLAYDNAHGFFCDFWPPSATFLLDKRHLWPEPHIIDDIVRNGCHFVAIGHKLGIYEDIEWRISFSLAEQKLVYSMNHCQFLLYGLLKLFLTEIINDRLGDDDKFLCSYHMKTAVFWMIQQNTISHWCPQNLLGCFWICFKLILKWVYEGVCPNFFIPQNNMFLSKIHCEAQRHLFFRLYGLYEKGFAFLLNSPSMWSFITNTLCNIGHSICTYKNTLISETEFDLELIRNLTCADMVPTVNFQTFINILQNIDQIKGSAPLSEYQVLMLKRLSACARRETAFLLHMKTCTYGNKLRYSADKLSRHLLVFPFKCITDLLYRAMYYYKTLRYTDALSLIGMIKAKFAQPYVIYDYNVDIEVCMEALRGHSWSTKLKRFVPLVIRLDNKIHYIRELIPEQQSAQEGGFPLLNVSPLVLLHMLEILCYRYVDTGKAKSALVDLENLVHYNQGQNKAIAFREISWQMLGICQKLTGNLSAAIYSYKKFLSQPEFHPIQTATELRMKSICQEIYCILKILHGPNFYIVIGPEGNIFVVDDRTLEL